MYFNYFNVLNGFYFNITRGQDPYAIWSFYNSKFLYLLVKEKKLVKLVIFWRANKWKRKLCKAIRKDMKWSKLFHKHFRATILLSGCYISKSSESKRACFNWTENASKWSTMPPTSSSFFKFFSHNEGPTILSVYVVYICIQTHTTLQLTAVEHIPY